MTIVARRLALALVLAASCLPSPAQSETGRPADGGSRPQVDTVQPPSDGDSASVEVPRSASGYLTRAACFPVLWAIGTPVAMMRDARKEWIRETRVWTKESKSPLALVPAGLFWTPLASFAGFIRGPVIAGSYAWSSRPFSKDSLSLGENLKWHGPAGEGNETEP